MVGTVAARGICGRCAGESQHHHYQGVKPSLTTRAPCRDVRARFYRQYTEHGISRDLNAVPENPLNVEVHKTEDEVAAALVSIVIDAAMESIARKNTFTMAIPGGSVLKALGALVDQPMGPAMRMDWRKVHIAYLNHRCVPESDPKSAHSLAREVFLDALPMFPNVSTVDGELTAEEEAKRYSEMILAMAEKAKMPMDPVTDMPQFDLILVGMGADGHVGSLYPGDDALKAPEGTMVVPNIKGDGSQSITFTPHLMSSCQRAVICCTGASKAAAVRMALEEPDRAPGASPAALIQPRDIGAELTWLLDTAAASELEVYKAMRRFA